MRRTIIGYLALAITALAGCEKAGEPAGTADVSTGKTVGEEFSVIASSPLVKTESDGLYTNWASGDAVNVFHALAGSTDYVSDGKFTVSDITDPDNVVFSGTLAATLDDSEKYDWYMVYPYNANVTTPAMSAEVSTSGWLNVGDMIQGDGAKEREQAGTSTPLTGKASDVSGTELPRIVMNHVCGFIRVTVNNSTSEAVPVTDVAVASAGSKFAGRYYIDFSGGTASLAENRSYESVTCQKAVSVAAGSSADFILSCAPVTIASGSTVSVTVNGYTKSLVLDADFDLKAGHRKTLTFNYDKDPGTAELPLSVDGSLGLSAYMVEDAGHLAGLSYHGLETYSATEDNTSCLIKMSHPTADYLQYHFDSAAGKVTAEVMRYGTGTSSLFVKGSADGLSFTEIQTFEVASGEASTTETFATTASIPSTYRYIRIERTDAASQSNIAVGAVSITKSESVAAKAYAKVASLAEGDYLIAWTNGTSAAIMDVSSVSSDQKYASSYTVDLTDGTIAQTDAVDSCLVTLESAGEENVFYIKVKATGKYIRNNSKSSNLYLDDNTTKNPEQVKYRIESDGDGHFAVSSQATVDSTDDKSIARGIAYRLDSKYDRYAAYGLNSASTSQHFGLDFYGLQ